MHPFPLLSISMLRLGWEREGEMCGERGNGREKKVKGGEERKIGENGEISTAMGK